MIQPLRAIHRRAFVSLAIMLPAILLVGLVERRPRPPDSTSAAPMPASAYLVRKSDTLWRKHKIQSKFYRDPNSQQIYVLLAPEQDLGEPDLMLYWASNEPHGNTLPAAQARLLGAFVPDKAFVLPQDDVARTHYLVLYSLAHESAVDSAMLEKLP